jgi:hypothetical protein
MHRWNEVGFTVGVLVEADQLRGGSSTFVLTSARLLRMALFSAHFTMLLDPSSCAKLRQRFSLVVPEGIPAKVNCILLQRD